LLVARKKQRLPHISYDVDGDGVVSHRDYMFAAIFDSNKDGILTEEERAEGLK